MRAAHFWGLQCGLFYKSAIDALLTPISGREHPLSYSQQAECRTPDVQKD
jgi:hypothetical protein